MRREGGHGGPDRPHALHGLNTATDRFMQIDVFEGYWKQLPYCTGMVSCYHLCKDPLSRAGNYILRGDYQFPVLCRSVVD